ncbi:MAG: hypothetical protein RJP96_10755, partial [Algiphilus sp.]|uniref:hypothetical protein n=1 Tax=Algiphilus sp. TaxID=1872431 RepID=UPI0032ED316F
SISTLGGVEGGDIIIRHSESLNNTPFDIGNASTNGTIAAITSGEFTLAPSQSFPFTHIEGNIQLVTGLNSLPSDIIQTLSSANRDPHSYSRRIISNTSDSDSYSRRIISNTSD